MRYLSLFSGIEMAGLAWQPLGWDLVAVAEVDPFACAVLAHHHPDVPNLGDVSAVTDDQIVSLGRIDVVIGGFPCQDVSLAGKRKGLRNDDGTATRSGLFFDAMRLVRAANPRCLVIENVPGLYSNRGGRDFADVLGEVVGSTFDVPREGWQDTGAAAGPRGMVEWCCLDSQWRSLAQRRERVFFVADFGNWFDRSPILLERESMQGNPPACVAARQRPAVGASGRTRRKGIWEQIADAFRPGFGLGPASIAGALAASDGKADADATDAESGRLIPTVSPPLLAHANKTGGHRQPGMDIDTCESLIPIASTGDLSHCLNGGGMRRIDFESETLIAHTLRGGGFDASEDGTGRGTPVIPLLATAFSCKDDGRDATFDLSPTMRSMNFDKSHANAGGQLAIAFNARQDPDTSGDVTHPLDTDGSSIGIAFDTTQITSGENRSNPQPGDPCHPLSSTAHPPALATAYEVRRLTPKECCRLQGVPDDYLDITYRGKPAADGNKYKALGNGFSVPVVRWIGERIELALNTQAGNDT